VAGTRVTATLPIAIPAERVVVDRAAVSSAYPSKKRRK
jgi:hypothetical protein